MAKALIRILVVEDNEPFRRFARSTLGERADFQIIAEASDGLEAVRAAAELQPDLILLDIGLPELNGIEAARQSASNPPNQRFFSSVRTVLLRLLRKR